MAAYGGGFGVYGQVFSLFGELWLVGSQGSGGICTGRRLRDGSGIFANCGNVRWALGIRGGGVA